MATRRALAGLAAALGVALAAACHSDAFAPVTIQPPDSLIVQARSLSSTLLQWTPAGDPNTIAYQVERRRDLAGSFEVIAATVPQSLPGPIFYLDQGLEAESFYGYRIRVVDRFGGLSEPSVVRGTRTPPVPGIVVKTTSLLEAPGAADGDGYAVAIMHGADTLVGALSPTGERRFGPLAPGDYQVLLLGLATNCAVDTGGMMRSARVTDLGLQTLTRVVYVVSCTDPQLGRITARMDVDGENRDSNGVLLRLEGAHPGAPDSLKVTLDSARFNGPDGGLRSWTRLRPGNFQVTLTGLDPKCTPDATTRSVTVQPLSDDTVHFQVTCPTPTTDTATVLPGYQLRNTWGAESGGKITLTLSIDMGAYEDPAVNGNGPDDIFAVQGATNYDSTRLRFVSAANVGGSGLQNLASNGATKKGVVQWGNFSTNAAKQFGMQGVAVITFDVLGSGNVTTRTEVSVAGDQDGDDLLAHVAVREAIATLGSGGPVNQSPVAHANGPYSGTAGTPVSFSASGSTDADGSIASYAWSFGDGGTGTSASPSHSYASAGSYTATLIVTDNQGATGQSTAQVTITAAGGGGGNVSPLANANGPYFGTAGTPVNFNSAGSNDPDGTITGYAWSFGDGGTGTGATAQHTYAAAGTWTATLTVTDNNGATGQSSTQVNVAAAGGQTPFTWSGTFSGNAMKDSIVTLTIPLDLSADISQTSGTEELAAFVVDSLKWNPAVLQFFSYNHGPGGFGSVQNFPGKLSINGQLGPANRTGVITIAVIKFKVVGTSGTSMTTSTTLGALTGTANTGAFAYRPFVHVQEATLTIQ